MRKSFKNHTLSIQRTIRTNVRLPHELIDWIIDHLHDDRAALSACCFVCKAWLASSRYHLFKDIHLGSNTRCDDILALPPPSVFAVAARRLMLTRKMSLPPGIEHFSSINSFYLVATTPNADMLTRIPLIFSRLTLLEINIVNFNSFAQMVQLICALPNLETLTQSLDGSLQAPPNTRPLDLGSQPTQTFLAGSIDLDHSVDLRSFSFTLVQGWPKLLYRILLTHVPGTSTSSTPSTRAKTTSPNLDLLDWRIELDHLITAPSTAFRLMDVTVRVYARNIASFVSREMVKTRFAPMAGAAGMVRYVSEKARLSKVKKELESTGGVALVGRAGVGLRGRSIGCVGGRDFDF
ncbi:hypothetical protein D9615_007147 [Tricholomella constricta]|uniref:F-box domain-containing protein n=1 Tax=Tricholomella constricta TaxID=117010 RepID=A0A8H5H8E4_9AGAR|nr:hypothetical protein D9615_007147 [Tricholomella constricta]